jgi:hypothetical protein
VDRYRVEIEDPVGGAAEVRTIRNHDVASACHADVGVPKRYRRSIAFKRKSKAQRRGLALAPNRSGPTSDTCRMGRCRCAGYEMR